MHLPLERREPLAPFSGLAVAEAPSLIGAGPDDPRRANHPDYLRAASLGFVADELASVRCASVLDERGRRIVLYQHGAPSLPKLVLLPPYGVSYVLLARLAALLAERFHVLSWESPGCPDNAAPVDESDLGLDWQSALLRRIVAGQGYTDFHFVGWCQAAQLAVHAVSTGAMAPATMTWIAPAGLGCAMVQSDFDRCALPIYLDIERGGAALAAKLAVMLDKHRSAPFSPANAAEKLTMLHLADPALTHTFSRYMGAYARNQAGVHSMLASALATCPTLAIHCKDDTYSHFSESVQLAKRSPNVALKLLPKGGHLQLFNDPATLAPLITQFIDDSGAGAPARAKGHA
ncbi:MAG TPA: alpha/beta fold hydrolase [Duganella sp.]|nr:alpha/beta fold hydrolase [Duganella sp.]